MTIDKIYIDMDGVLADFDRGLIELCNVNPIDQSTKTEDEDATMWDKVRTVEHFYDKLPLISGASEAIFNLYKRYGDKCEILTGVPKEKRNIPEAGDDKIHWVHRLINPQIKVNICYKEDKQKFCTGKGSLFPFPCIMNNYV